MDNFQIKPYCYEEDQTHKRLFGYDECAYCAAPLCIYCKDATLAIGKWCSMKTGEAFQVCACHKKAHQESQSMFFDRF